MTTKFETDQYTCEGCDNLHSREFSLLCKECETAADEIPDDYESRVRAYEAQGMTRSDAQAVVDAEDEQKVNRALPVGPHDKTWCG